MDGALALAAGFFAAGLAGTALIGGKEHRLSERDVIVVPSWNEVRLSASKDLMLFAMSDKATQQKLNSSSGGDNKIV